MAEAATQTKQRHSRRQSLRLHQRRGVESTTPGSTLSMYQSLPPRFSRPEYSYSELLSAASGADASKLCSKQWRDRFGSLSDEEGVEEQLQALQLQQRRRRKARARRKLEWTTADEGCGRSSPSVAPPKLDSDAYFTSPPLSGPKRSRHTEARHPTAGVEEEMDAPEVPDVKSVSKTALTESVGHKQSTLRSPTDSTRSSMTFTQRVVDFFSPSKQKSGASHPAKKSQDKASPRLLQNGAEPGAAGSLEPSKANTVASSRPTEDACTKLPPLPRRAHSRSKSDTLSDSPRTSMRKYSTQTPSVDDTSLLFSRDSLKQQIQDNASNPFNSDTYERISSLEEKILELKSQLDTSKREKAALVTELNKSLQEQQYLYKSEKSQRKNCEELQSRYMAALSEKAALEQTVNELGVEGAGGTLQKFQELSSKIENMSSENEGLRLLLEQFKTTVKKSLDEKAALVQQLNSFMQAQAQLELDRKRAEEESERYRQFLRAQFSVSHVVSKLLKGPCWQLYSFQTLEQKLEVLDQIEKSCNPEAMLRVALFLENTLRESLFRDELRQRPLCLNVYISYLRKHDPLKLVRLFIYYNRLRDAALLQLWLALRLKDSKRSAAIYKCKSFMQQHGCAQFEYEQLLQLLPQ